MKNSEPQKVIAIDIATGLKVGEYDSISQAAKKLYIRYPENIWRHLFGDKNFTFKRKKKGIASYKTKIKYRFEKLDK